MEIRRCIVCDSKDLNTSMEVQLLGQLHKIHLCTEHSEDTTPGKSKELLKSKLEELDDIHEKASFYGMKLISLEEYEDLKSKKAAAKKKGLIKTPPARLVEAMRQPSEQGGEEVNADAKLKRKYTAHELRALKEDLGVDDFVPRSDAEKVKIDNSRGNISSGGSPHKVKREKDLVLTHRVVHTSTGRPISIPVKMASRDGTTTVAIAKGGDNRLIQDRLKNNKENPILHEYDRLTECSACRGLGVSRMDPDKKCQKCSGTGFFNL